MNSEKMVFIHCSLYNKESLSNDDQYFASANLKAGIRLGIVQCVV